MSKTTEPNQKMHGSCGFAHSKEPTNLFPEPETSPQPTTIIISSKQYQQLRDLADRCERMDSNWNEEKWLAGCREILGDLVVEQALGHNERLHINDGVFRDDGGVQFVEDDVLVGAL